MAKGPGRRRDNPGIRPGRRGDWTIGPGKGRMPKPPVKSGDSCLITAVALAGGMLAAGYGLLELARAMA